jgi:hypothetical protein
MSVWGGKNTRSVLLKTKPPKHKERMNYECFFLSFFLGASLLIGRALDHVELESLTSLSWDLLDPQISEPLFPLTLLP